MYVWKGINREPCSDLAFLRCVKTRCCQAQLSAVHAWVRKVPLPRLPKDGNCSLRRRALGVSQNECEGSQHLFGKDVQKVMSGILRAMYLSPEVNRADTHVTLKSAASQKGVDTEAGKVQRGIETATTLQNVSDEVAGQAEIAPDRLPNVGP